MKKRPWEILVISVILFLAPIGNVLQSLFFNRIPLGQLLSKFRVIDWVILLGYPVVGALILSVKKWAWYLSICFSFFLLIFNVVAYIRNPHYEIWALIAFNVLSVAVFIPLFLKHIMSPYFNPRIRWWEVPSRFKLNLSATLHTDQNIVESQILDISESGCFVQTDTPLEIGTKIWLEIKFSDKQVDCFGKVVRSAGKKEDKNGYGILFLSIGRESRNILVSLLRTLHKMGIDDRTFSEEMNRNLAKLVK